jgi:hypothetical protein
MRAALEQAGFEVVAWDGRTQKASSDSPSNRRRAPPLLAAPLLGLHVVMGPDFPALSAILGRNLRRAESASCRPFSSVDREYTPREHHIRNRR